jgi:hypothetical protein
VDVTTSRQMRRRRLELVLLVSTVLACGYALFAPATLSAPVRVFDRIDAIAAVDVLQAPATHQWTGDIVVNAPDSSDDDDDDDGDDGGLTVEAPVRHDAAKFHEASPHFCIVLDLSSCWTSNNHSLRAPPL